MLYMPAHVCPSDAVRLLDRRRGLFDIKANQEAYWEGERIDADWPRRRKAWQMLWKLATNASITSSVNDIDLYQERVSYSTMYNRWARLKPLLPSSLSRLISVGAERATYRLELAINKIHIFDLAAPVTDTDSHPPASALTKLTKVRHDS